MKQLLLCIIVILCLGSMSFAKDTVDVQGYYESGYQYGTLNAAIQAAKVGSTINNTVFRLKPYEIYVLNSGIFIDYGQSIDIVAPKPLRAGEGTPEEVQNSAPPQIVWTEETIDRARIIQSLGDITMKNVWVRYADILGSKVSSSITFEDSLPLQDKDKGYFEGCLFDYDGIGSDAGGAITVKADHFVGIFKNCYFRNLSDNHFQYYGRAVSFPFESTDFHYDSLLFENCSFTNISRIVMQEGNEYGDNVHINHCTMLNSIEWVFQSAGWIRESSITNSIFINPYMFGYRALDVCDDDQDYDDFEAGLCDPPGGGLINGITQVDSFGFVVPFTDQDRRIFIGNNVYMFQDWMADWYRGCVWCKEQIKSRLEEELYNPPPMLGDNEIAFIDSTDGLGNKVFPKMNVDWTTIYQEEDPDFIVPATNLDTIKIFIEYKWSTAADIDWSYEPRASFLQQWPLPENLAYNNTTYQTAAMGNFPLGDLSWYPAQLPAWEAQRDAEWVLINQKLDGYTAIKTIADAVPGKYVLEQNYPNPFNPSTKIEYSIPEAGHVSLKVYNTLGQLVATMHDGYQKAGKYQATFNANNLASGVYIYRLKVNDVSISKKFSLVK
ncbi:MAG: T9SS type A sorting domain-containing protein [Calditrichaceae bacterium]|nr:T9SS type A sorting domain-containing protein [Calditrichaceae bacterium]MBN2708356.1 T9SS type A sorting domain-containing protein [Calditrichaceae bacterium]RQV94608.1 MAG: T9SS C-terminal target domain-containing protein [Calditrichota bacterium]